MSEAARCRAVVGRGLPAQGSMQLDLQDLRQFRIDRRHRPRDRGVERGPDTVERDRERLGERGVVVQRAARRKLRGEARPLEHLLGRGEKSCERLGEVGVAAPAVDGQLGAAESRGGPPVLARGKCRDGESACHRRLRAVLQQRPGVWPVAHEDRLAVLEREPRLLFLPRER